MPSFSRSTKHSIYRLPIMVQKQQPHCASSGLRGAGRPTVHGKGMPNATAPCDTMLFL